MAATSPPEALPLFDVYGVAACGGEAPTSGSAWWEGGGAGGKPAKR